jgi:hypothetical protein
MNCLSDPHSYTAHRCRWAYPANRYIYVWGGVGNWDDWNVRSAYLSADVGFGDTDLSYFRYLNNSSTFGYTFPYVDASVCIEDGAWNLQFIPFTYVYIAVDSAYIDVLAETELPYGWGNSTLLTDWIGVHEMGHALSLNHFRAFHPNPYYDSSVDQDQDVMRPGAATPSGTTHPSSGFPDGDFGHLAIHYPFDTFSCS